MSQICKFALCDVTKRALITPQDQSSQILLCVGFTILMVLTSKRSCMNLSSSCWVWIFGGFLFFNVFCSVLQSRDPQLQLSLDNYPSVFSVSPAGIKRFLTLMQPLDRESQETYTFTVRHHDTKPNKNIFCLAGIFWGVATQRVWRGGSHLSAFESP